MNTGRQSEVYAPTSAWGASNEDVTIRMMLFYQMERHAHEQIDVW